MKLLTNINKNLTFLAILIGGLLFSVTGIVNKGKAVPSITNRSSYQKTSDHTFSGWQRIPNVDVDPIKDQISIKLVNDINAPVSYQAIEGTEPRILPPLSEITLQGLKAPVNLTFYRDDGGLIQAIPDETSMSQMLELTFKETESLAADDLTLRIDQDGNVSIN